MNLENLRRLLTTAFGQPQAFNSNNSWGFGGGIGERWAKGDTVVKIFTAHYRHLKPSKAITVTVAGRRIMDEIQSPKSFEQAAEILSLGAGSAREQLPTIP